ncbi:DUF5696 domain-containing protein [Paenibacillus gansuensis]|uniref:DUF5696 domain-containing protein n=1 Tax=Paenibacillus gansuensis TaxID=306542 RepID=A0ABW5PKG8_9BACL
MFNAKWKLAALAAVLLAGGGSVISVYGGGASDAPGTAVMAAGAAADAQSNGNSGADGGSDGGIALTPAKPDRQDELSFFRSNGYTKPEAAVQPPVPAAKIEAGYEPIGQNGKMALYMNKKTFAIQLQDLASGYVWSSVPSAKDFQAEELNEDWKNAMQSPFIIDFFAEDAFRTTSNYRSLQGKAASMKAIDNGMEVTYELPAIQSKLTVRVALDKDGLVVRLLNDSIQEKGPSRIASVQMYPFLGSVRGGSVPGYLFIPDGSGALIRFTDNHSQFDEPYVGQIYANDIAVTGFDGMGSTVRYPVFGIVHGVNKNALVGMVEDGKMNAEIVAYPSGVNTNFYWISTRFQIRSAYFQPTSKAMGGINMYTKNKTEGDKQVRYHLLSGSKADYVGMAQEYKGYLEQNGMLPEASGSSANAGGDIPMRLDLLGSEMAPGILKRGVVKMTSFAEAQAILEDLKKAGIRNIQAGIQGWGKSGITGAQPAAPGYEKAIGGKQGLKTLLEYTKREGIGLYLNTDYTNLISGAPRVEPRADAVRMVNNRLIEYRYVGRYVSDLYKDLKGYMLSPATAQKLAAKDFSNFRKDGLDQAALNSTGFFLYSDYNKKHKLNRTKSAELYGSIGEEAAKQSLKLNISVPNDYMLKHASAYFDMPLTSAQFMYTTDTVPFVPIVMHGVMPYYAGYGNNNPDPELDMLRAIEYGANPAFLVTHEPSWKLQNTPSGFLYTTQYQDWAPEIKKQYAKANEVLKQVQQASIAGRSVPALGIVKVSYDNGVSVWVNYTSSDYKAGGVTVKARSAAAVTGGEQP